MPRRANTRRDWSPYGHAMTPLFAVRDTEAYASGDLEAVDTVSGLALNSEVVVHSTSGSHRIPRWQQAELYAQAQRRYELAREAGSQAVVHEGTVFV